MYNELYLSVIQHHTYISETVVIIVVLYNVKYKWSLDDELMSQSERKVYSLCNDVCGRSTYMGVWWTIEKNEPMWIGWSCGPWVMPWAVVIRVLVVRYESRIVDIRAYESEIKVGVMVISSIESRLLFKWE